MKDRVCQNTQQNTKVFKRLDLHVGYVLKKHCLAFNRGLEGNSIIELFQ